MEEFDDIVDRRGTASSKWDRYAGRDVLPFWVADTDFRVPTFILDRLRRRLDHGVLGYTRACERLHSAACQWLAEQFDWPVEPPWLVWLPGVVPGLNLACRAVTTPRDRVIVQPPVYYPFLSVAANAGCASSEVPLTQREDGAWETDFTALSTAMTPDTRLLLLCNPQNPTGRAYRTDELDRLAELCLRHDIVICSDEIHCGLLLDNPHPHVPIATLSPEVARRTITLMAPSKTYGMPGLGCAFAVIPDPALRERFIAARAGLVPYPGVLALEAAIAAYEDRSDWVARLNRYLAANRDLLAAAVSAMPGVAMNRVEATYLAWLDVRALALADAGGYFESHGIGISDGVQFRGPGFVRFNFGCQRATLAAGIERLTQAVRARRAELDRSS
jgi:cysteine-S-conjugate beta-lyase